MTGVLVDFRKNSQAKRENDFGLENALAAWVCRRWADKTISHVAHHFDLSESEASKVVYGNASKNTLKKLLHHKRGGFGLFVELLADACNTSLEQHIHTQAERAAHERRTWEAEERRLAALAARVSSDSGERRSGAVPLGGRRSSDARVG